MAERDGQDPQLKVKPTLRKRKEPPSAAPIANAQKKPRTDHRTKQRDARSLATQTSSKAFKHGELDVDRFVKAREYEIRALEESMSRSKKSLTTRAFQQVPKELRRRTASHSVKRVPKRLQSRAKREMIEDNTPTITARRRKPTKHMRLRLQTVKKLRALNAKHKSSKEQSEDDWVFVKPVKAPSETNPDLPTATVQTRVPKAKKSVLAAPSVPKAKFRKRQIHKSWLPTHIFHAKRAHMSPPKEPLWRFAIPLTPTAKCYRTTHRVASQRGAIAWDTSYIATIGLQGQQRSIESVLRALRLACYVKPGQATSSMFRKWCNGTRTWEGLVSEREPPHRPVAPVVVIWAVAPESKAKHDHDEAKRRRTALIRVHPSAFLQLWDELLRLSKTVKPHVSVEDLRFEMGSIEITGPSASEALSAALWPVQPADPTQEVPAKSVESVWTSLSGLTNPALLPAKALLGFDVQDPRLHFPPRPCKTSGTDETSGKLLESLAAWPIDTTQSCPAIFDRQSRQAASGSLPSQKAINRRKATAAPGSFPDSSPKDPKIPILIYTRSLRDKAQQIWTVLLPWKCVQPVWYSIIYCPLSTGGQTHFGGLQERRQVAFEVSAPWFPGDFPGTQAGWDWELHERKKRKEEWLRKPKSKRVNWDALNLGEGRKGEIGDGWSCDWGTLCSGPSGAEQGNATVKSADASARLPAHVCHLPAEDAQAQLSLEPAANPDLRNGLVIVRLTLLNRGVPQTCARIYRLPSASTSGKLRQRWLAQANHKEKPHGNRLDIPRISQDEPAYITQRRLAQSLLEVPRPGDSNFPACPAEDDLIGFVTTGNFDLSAGKGRAIGSLQFSKILDQLKANGTSDRLCVVRNAGSEVGRLATFELI